MLTNPTLPTILFLTGVFNFILGVIVFRENPQKALNRVTGFMLVGAAIGAIFNSLSPSIIHVISTEHIYDFGARSSLLWELFFPLLLNFSLLFPRRSELLEKYGRVFNVLFVLYLLRFALVAIFPSGEHLHSFFAQSVTGDGLIGNLLKPISLLLAILDSIFRFYYTLHPYLFLVLNTICVVLAVGFMVDGYNRLSDKTMKRRVGLVITGLVASILIYCIALFLPYFQKSPQIVKASYGAFLIADFLFTISLVWAIFRFQFLNTRLFLRRGLVFSAITAVLVLGFLFLYGETKRLLANVIDTDVPVFELLFLLLAVFFVQPTIEFLNSLLDKIFHREKLDNDQVTKISREVLSAIKIETVYVRCLPLVQTFFTSTKIDLFIAGETKYSDPIQNYNRDTVFWSEGDFVELLRQTDEIKSLDQYRVQLTDETELAHLNELSPQLVIPIKNRNSLVGILFMQPKVDNSPYHSNELELLELFAMQLGIALENIRLYEIAQAQRLLQEELAVASHIQRMLLPLDIPIGKNFEVASINIPSKEVGGDYHDFIRLSDEKLGIAIGDIAGKGVPGAILMSNLQASLRAHAPISSTSNKVVGQVNQLMARTTSPEKYATFLYAVFDENTKQLEFCNAGHNYPILKKNKKTCELIRYANPIIGVDEKINFKNEILQLESGDMVIFYTDGITEALNSETVEYGDDRLLDFINNQSNSDVQVIKNRIYDDILSFTQGVEQYDDITFIILKVK